MIELRCVTHMHAKVDADEATFEVKCSQCSRKRGAPVFHQWTWAQLQRAHAQGRTILWPCEPEASREPEAS